MDRHDEIVKLREAGLTYAEIGRRLDISKQRVKQIVKVVPKPPKYNLNSKVMLTTADTAYLLGVRGNTVRRWSDQGILKAYRVSPRGDRRFKREDIDKFLQGSIDGSTADGETEKEKA